MKCPKCNSNRIESINSKLVYGYHCKDCDNLFSSKATTPPLWKIWKKEAEKWKTIYQMEKYAAETDLIEMKDAIKNILNWVDSNSNQYDKNEAIYQIAKQALSYEPEKRNQIPSDAQIYSYHEFVLIEKELASLQKAFKQPEFKDRPLLKLCIKHLSIYFCRLQERFGDERILGRTEAMDFMAYLIDEFKSRKWKEAAEMLENRIDAYEGQK